MHSISVSKILLCTYRVNHIKVKRTLNDISKIKREVRDGNVNNSNQEVCGYIKNGLNSCNGGYCS